MALAAAVLLLPETNLAQRIQLGIIVSVGLLLLFFGISQGAQVDWPAVVSQNTGMLSMVLSVGLLKLIISHGSVATEKLPVGRRAYWHTLLSLSLFGSIINISAPVLISDRLTMNRPMDYFTAATVTRIFCMCAAWSPFFAGTAIVLTAVNGVHLQTLVLNGLPLLIIAVLLSYFSATMFHSEKLEKFHGYPLRADSLFVPLLLALMVFLAAVVTPTISILVVIATSAIVLTAGLLIMRVGIKGALRLLGGFVAKDLPRSVNETQLFLSAGVLASGLQAMVQILTACIVLAVMIFVSACGIHPVIQIAALTPLILETSPNLELLGLTFMFSWCLGTCASPLSGTNLMMQGRFGIVAWRGAIQNWPFVGIMYVFACVLLQVRGSLGQ